MSIWRQFAAGLRRLIKPISKDEEIAEEVRQYFDEATAEWVTAKYLRKKQSGPRRWSPEI